VLTLETITESDLRGPLNDRSLRRARGYLNRVISPIRRGETLAAQVRGTRIYDVEVTVAEDRIIARCTCPYDWGGYCKHIGALILAWIYGPEDFDVEAADLVPDGGALPVTPVSPPSTHRPEELPSWLTITPIDRQAGYERDLARVLDAISIQDLRQVAERRGWKARGIRKDRVVRQVVEHLVDRDETLRVIRGLDREHRQVLCALTLCGEIMVSWPDSVRGFASIWGSLQAYQKAETYTRHLCEMGLAIPGEASPNHHYDVVPRSLARAFPPLLSRALGLWPPPGGDLDASPSDEDAGTVREQRLADPHAFIRRVNQVIILLERESSPLRPPMPRPAMEKRLRGLTRWDYDPRELAEAARANRLYPNTTLSLTVPPPPYILPDETIERLAPLAGGEACLEFIVSLLMAAGVFQPGSPLTPWPRLKQAFFQRDPLMRRAILTRTYFRISSWSALWEMLRQPTSRLVLRRHPRFPYFSPDHLEAYLTTFRWVVLGGLALLPDDEWVTLDDLDLVMRALLPRLDQPARQGGRLSRHDYYWFLSESGTEEPLDPEDLDHWQLAQGAFMRTIIGGPLHWLGLADLRFDRGELRQVRFHGLSDLFFDRVEAPPAPPHASAGLPAASPAPSVVLEGSTITVQPSALSDQAHGLLDQIARLVTVEPDRFVYQLDAAAVYETFEAGGTLSRMLDAWERLLPVPLPDVMHAQLTAWWEAYGRLRVYRDVTVIEFGDEYALAEMKAVTSLEEHLVAELSPRLVVIPSEVVDRLVRELREAGHTPKTTDRVETPEGTW
jgi:hypothetical protein